MDKLDIDKIERMRRKMGLTQEQLATSNGLSRDCYTRFMTNNRKELRGDLKTLVKIARGLDVHPGELFINDLK